MGQITLSTIGQATDFETLCGNYGIRRTLYNDGHHLELPDAVTDKSLRWLVDQGMGIMDAYAQVGWKNFLPAEGMRECCREVLRQKWLDENSEWQLSGWGFTCAGYNECLEKYAAGVRETTKIGRMKIADGVYSPAPDEELCIRRRFAAHSDIARAYSDCNVLDIAPRFPGGMAALQQSMIADRAKEIHQPMYKMISSAYSLLVGFPPDGTAPPPPDQSDHHSAGEDKETNNTMLYLAGGIVLAFFLFR